MNAKSIGSIVSYVISSNKIVLLTFGLGILYWVVESAFDSFVFHEGSLITTILTLDPHEIWMRAMVLCFLVTFGFYVQFIITKRKQAEEVLRKQTHALGERVKELNCLYGISGLVEKQDISLEEIFQGVVDVIPPAWQYPEITCARITIGDKEFKTDNFKRG